MSDKGEELNVRSDRRHFDLSEMLHSYIFPAIFMAATAYLTVNVTLATMGVELENVKQDIIEDRALRTIMFTNQLEVAKMIEWQKSRREYDARTAKEIDKLWNFVGDLKTQVEKGR